MNTDEIIRLINVAAELAKWAGLAIACLLGIYAVVAMAVARLVHREHLATERQRLEQQHQWNMANLMLQQTGLIVDLERSRSGR